MATVTTFIGLDNLDNTFSHLSFGGITINGFTQFIVVNGNGGIDTFDFSTFMPGSDLITSGVTVDLANSRASGSFVYQGPILTGQIVTGGLTLVNFENVVGSNLADSLSGDDNDNLIRGLSGNDLIYGGDGIDTLDGGDDHDDIFGGNGGDKAYGGNGDDLIRGEAGDDLIFGNDGVDTLDGGDGNDEIYGGFGIDKIYGGNGIDRLFGEAGVDLIFGNDGADIITGGTGRDTLNGGAGADKFNYDSLAEAGNSASTRDLIQDFSQGADKIELLRIDANTRLAGNQAFVFGGLGSTFSGTTGQLRYYRLDVAGTASDRTFVIGDVNGDRVTDFQIEIAGLKTLLASDFVL